MRQGVRDRQEGWGEQPLEPNMYRTYHKLYILYGSIYFIWLHIHILFVILKLNTKISKQVRKTIKKQ